MKISYQKIGYKICEVLYWALLILFIFSIFSYILIDDKFEILVFGDGKLEGLFCRAMLLSIILLSFTSLIFKNKILALIVLCLIAVVCPLIYDFIKFIN